MQQTLRAEILDTEFLEKFLAVARVEAGDFQLELEAERAYADARLGRELADFPAGRRRIEIGGFVLTDIERKQERLGGKEAVTLDDAPHVFIQVYRAQGTLFFEVGFDLFQHLLFV